MKKFIFIFMFLCTNVFASNNVMDKTTITPVPAQDYLYIIDNGTSDGKATISSVLTQSESTLEGLLDLQDLQGAVTDAQVPNDITVNTATTATTASALAANGANCSSGNAPLGVDAAGAVESCFDVWTESENTAAGYITAADTAAKATALAANGANCAAGSYPLGVDSSGAVESCTDATTEINSAISAAASNYESATSNDFDPDRLAGDTVDDNKVDAGIIADLSATYQSADVDLTIYAGITPSANVQSLLGAATYAAMRTLLDLEAGTDFYSKSALDTDFAFATFPTTPSAAPDADYEVANKKYVDDNSGGSGDMTKAVYDTNDDGYVDRATTAGVAESGDSATAFFSSGTLETARLDGDGAGDCGSGKVCLGDHTHSGYEPALTDKASLESTISDVSDFAEADGDTYTGTHDFSGGVVTLPSTAGIGVGIINGIESITKTIIDPDSIQSTEDAVPLFYVNASSYPNGITLASTSGAGTGIRLFADQASTASFTIEEWSDSTTYLNDIVTITFGSSTSAAPQSALSDASIAAGHIIMIDLDTTDLNFLGSTIPFTKD